MIYEVINQYSKKYTWNLVYNEQSMTPFVILDPVAWSLCSILVLYHKRDFMQNSPFDSSACIICVVTFISCLLPNPMIVLTHETSCQLWHHYVHLRLMSLVLEFKTKDMMEIIYCFENRMLVVYISSCHISCLKHLT